MDSGLFFHLEIEEISISENKEIYGRHFESAAKNGTCFQDPIGFIIFSICASVNG